LEEWFFEYIKRIRREIDRMISEVEEAMTKPLISFERRCLTPLYEIRDSEDELILYVDLPKVRSKDDISVTLAEDKVIIDAKISSPISFGDIPIYSGQNYNRYYAEIRLPVPVEAKKTRASYRRGILEIRLPKKIKRYKVRIE